jgi:sec-independent protein translocase protein TatC
MARERPTTMLGHLAELRTRLIISGVALVIGAVVAFIFRDWIFDLLIEPYREVVTDRDLVFFRPTEAFSIFMRVSLFGGVVVASPILIWQLWAFVGPALTRREKRVAVPIVFVLVVLFLGGVAFGYWSLGRGLDFLLGFGGDSLEPVIGGDDYLSFALRFLLVFGFAFEFPVFLFFLALVGVVDHRSLARGRRWAVLGIVTIGAVVTPSGDPLTLLLLSVPLYMLYEATIWIVRFGLRR